MEILTNIYLHQRLVHELLEECHVLLVKIELESLQLEVDIYLRMVDGSGLISESGCLRAENAACCLLNGDRLAL